MSSKYTSINGKLVRADSLSWSGLRDHWTELSYWSHLNDRFTVWSNREPMLTIRKILYIVSTGWALFVLYAFAALGMALTIVFVPFAWQTLKFAWFALEPLDKEVFYVVPGPKTPIWANPTHPLTATANVVWLVLFGWELALLHLATAVVQALTIINWGAAVTNVALAGFVLWPFGRSIRTKHLPVTLEQLKAQQDKRPGTMEARTLEMV